MLLLNGLLFQFGWIACVVGGSQIALLYTSIALVIHHFYFIKKPSEWLLVIAIAMVGLGWDALMVAFGILDFGTGIFIGLPVWLICLWLIFATTFNHCLRWLQSHLFIAAILGAILAPLSYWLGTEISDATIALPVTSSLLFMATGWLFLFPLGLLLNKTYRNKVHYA